MLIFSGTLFCQTFWREVERLLPEARFWDAEGERVYISPRPIISSTSAYQTGGRLHQARPVARLRFYLPLHLHLLARLCAFSTLDCGRTAATAGWVYKSYIRFIKGRCGPTLQGGLKVRVTKPSSLHPLYASTRDFLLQYSEVKWVPP